MQNFPSFIKLNQLQANIFRFVSTKNNLKTIAAATNSINRITGDGANNSDLVRLDTKFENSEIAFKSKSTADLIRGWFVFQLCSISPLVNNQQTIMKISRNILGKRLFNILMKSTLYGHFVAGECKDSIKETIENMSKYNVKSILDYSAEEDLNSPIESVQSNQELSNSVYTKHYNTSEKKFDNNTKIFFDCIDAVYVVTNSTGLAAIKVTSLVRPEILLKFSDFILALKADKEKSNNLDWNNLQNDVLVKLLSSSEKIKFAETEIGEVKNLIIRLEKLINHAVEKEVRVFIDAEQTYFQEAIRKLTIEMMRSFNKKKNIVFNTYQNYLRSAHKDLLEDLALSKKENFYFGAKLVRGAYMEQERPRALALGYEDPINRSYEATTEMYEKNLLLCMNEIKSRPLGQVAVMVASHNEETVKFAVQEMDKLGIKASDRVICFGQLLGMCDYISFSLSAAGYSVYKYTPYGPVEEVLPYLSRRAVENRGIFDKVKKEKRLLFAEIKRRMFK